MNKTHKLSTDDKRLIRALYAEYRQLSEERAKVSPVAIAEKFGVTRHAVYGLVKK